MGDERSSIHSRPSMAALDVEQRARVEAAAAARWLLGRVRHADGALSADVVDIVSLASWLLTGEDPFVGVRAVDEDPDAPALFEPPVRIVRSQTVDPEDQP